MPGWLNDTSQEPDSEQYKILHCILDDVAEQLENGKGKERHADDAPFEKQSSLEIMRRVKESTASPALFQAVKKIYESTRLNNPHAIQELQGAIGYLVMAIILLKEEGE
jgi:hypothetical protein